MPFYMIRQDITKMETDAIVNAANSRLLMGGGVCGAIFKAAGPSQLQAACDKVSPVAAGGAAITPGFALPAKYVVHAVGPIYQPDRADECRQQLWSAYTQALKIAQEHGCGSIAFPLISSGIYGYPKREALEVAQQAITAFLEDHEDMEVWLTLFDREAFNISRELLGDVESYIDQHYVDQRASPRRMAVFERSEDISVFNAPAMPAKGLAKLEDLITELDEPFSDFLVRLIDRKGMKDPDVYKRANIDRRLFSKIRSGKGYIPGKRTVLALAIALELDLEETEALLKKAGYALTHSRRFDVIVEYFIVTGRYDIFEINQVLFQYDEPLLGAI